MQVETTWGNLIVEWVGGEVVGCTLPELTVQPSVPFQIQPRIDDPVSRFLVAVFSGRAGSRPPLATVPGTDFQHAVWGAIDTLAPGQTMSYGEIAAAIGRPMAARAVGTACAKNPLPLFIPCHRVTGANGGLGGFTGGLPWKRLLLNNERHAAFKAE